MPIRIDDRKEVTKTKTIEIDGEAVTIEYRPGVLTFQFERDMKALDAEAEPDLGFTTLFCQLVKSWDIEISEGVPLPVEPEALLSVPTDILLGVFGGVQKADAPGEATTAPSRGSSFGAGDGKTSPKHTN